MLRARAPADQVRFDRLVGDALAGLWRGRCQWVDGAPPLVRGAAVRGARQAGGRPSSGPRSAARGRAGADCRAGAPASHRSRPGGHDPGTDAGGDSGGGRAGGRHERRRHGRCDGAYESRHLLAPAADLPEALHLAAGGPGAPGAVARRTRGEGGRDLLRPSPSERGRPRRPSFQTTSTSPFFSARTQLSSPGRSSRPPDAKSWYRLAGSSMPSARRASRCRSSDWEPSAFEMRA